MEAGLAWLRLTNLDVGKSAAFQESGFKNIVWLGFRGGKAEVGSKIPTKRTLSILFDNLFCSLCLCCASLI
jgi:hypothetical protein